MKLNRILLPVDFSTSSDAALQYASGLASQSGAKLYILHVGESSTSYLVGYAGFADAPDLAQQVEQANRAALERIEPAAAGIEFERHYEIGSPAEEILAFAERENIDLIVLGSHGRTGLARLLMGSVAEAVVRRADCPVLTVKHPQLESETNETPAGKSADDESSQSRPRPTPSPATKQSLH